MMDYSNRRTAAGLHTVGHSNHPIGRFIELIGTAGIELIVDVRSVPFSRFAPQFNRETLEKSLASAHIGYCYLGDLLGGRPGGTAKGPPRSWEEASASASFREGLRRLWELSVSKRCAVMCAERDPNRCHRKHLIAASVVMMGGAVTHLLYDGTLTPERPEPCILR
jgi:uncharacterized protein (DUF488 family)